MKSRFASRLVTGAETVGLETVDRRVDGRNAVLLPFPGAGEPAPWHAAAPSAASFLLSGTPPSRVAVAPTGTAT